jgi:hypothetical protein
MVQKTTLIKMACFKANSEAKVERAVLEIPGMVLLEMSK